VQATLERLRRRREEQGDEGGFTLIELLIVIVILGILAAIVVFAVQNLSSSSSQASCGSDYKTVETALEAYKAQMGGYPNGSAATPATVISGTTGGPPPITDTQAGGDAAGPTGTAPLLSTSTSTAATTVNLTSPSGSTIGPWLKSIPGNGNHYQIAVSNDGLGTIAVTPAGTATNPCANAS
jgi:prepilin-type N-terminal cleavage/methylation domain-containing protein